MIVYSIHPIRQFMRNTRTKLQPFGMRIKNHLTVIKVDEESILPITVPNAPPWELSKVKVIIGSSETQKIGN